VAVDVGTAPTAEGTPVAERPVRALPWAATAFVAVVGGYQLIHRAGLWVDEGWSVSVAGRPLTGVFEVIANRERNMALYYVLLHFWLQASDDRTWVDALSLVFGVLTVPAVAWVGGLLGGPRVAAIAAMLTAAHMGLVAYAVDARAYPLGVLLAVLLVGCFIRLLSTHSPRWAVASVAVGWAFVATLLLGVLLLVALGVVALLRPDGRRPLVLATLAVQALTMGPVFLLVVATDRGAVDWIPAPTLRSVAEVLLLLAGGKIGIAVCAAVVLLFLLWQRRSRDRAGWLVLAWAVVPPVLLFAISLVKPMLLPRYVLFVVPAIGLMAGLALAGRRAGMLVAAVLSAVLLLSGATQDLIAREDDLTAATAFILDNERPGDAVVYDPAAARAWYGHYLGTWANPGDRPRDLALTEGGDPWQVGDVYGDEVPAAQIVERAAYVSRLWVVYYPGWGITGQTPEPFREARAEALAGRRIALQESFGSAIITLFVR
jgi:mannosyltransferase